MTADLQNIMPVYGIEDDYILSGKGDYTLAYQVTKPELFTLGDKDYELLHQTLIRAMQVLPPHTIVHWQDWYSQVRYKGDFKEAGADWLNHSYEKHHHELPWLDHQAYLFLTRTPQRRPASSLTSTLLRKHLFPADALDPRIREQFTNACGQFISILESCGLLSLTRLGLEDLSSTNSQSGLLERYCTLQPTGQPLLRDIAFKSGNAHETQLRIGEYDCQLFTLADAASLPPACGPRLDFDLFSTEKTRYSLGFTTSLGLLLPYNHMTNLLLFTGDPSQTISQMEARRLRLQSLAAYSRDNQLSQQATDAYLNEAISQQRRPIRAHFNVLAYTDQPGELTRIKNSISAEAARFGATIKLESTGAPQIYWACIPGNTGDFPMNDTFNTFIEQGSCFFQTETNYHSSPGGNGLRLGDRLSGRPINVDLDKTPMENGTIANGNAIVISSSGGGKSFFMNHLVRSYYQQGAHTVLIDVGHSYEMLCHWLGGYYFAYSEANPIQFNPFYLSEGESFDTEKRESIKTLIMTLWKQGDERQHRSEYVALSSALQHYIDRIGKDKTIFPCFDSFYTFLQNDFSAILAADQVKEKDFDLANLLYVLRPYTKGGEFDFLLNAEKNLDLLNERFIVFELDNIKDHRTLFPVVSLIISELFISKMRKIVGVPKIIVIEEAWKQIASQGMAGYVRYLFKTVRKFQAKAIVVTQEIEDIVSSEVVRQSIIDNADCRILLDQGKLLNKFDQLQQLLGLSEKQKTEILSLNKYIQPGHRYKELWIGLGPTQSKVYRLEVSPEEYYIYTSNQAEKARLRQYLREYGDIKRAVRALLDQSPLYLQRSWRQSDKQQCDKQESDKQQSDWQQKNRQS